jgi:hypothetical protein
MIATSKTEALTAALEAVDSAIGIDADESQRLVAAKVRGLLRGYDARWADAGYVALEVEKLLTADLVNPDTSKKSRTFKLAGKLDVIARSRVGQRVLFDHKTTSSDISDPAGEYWRQLVVEGQPSHYGLLGWANGIKFDSTVWDVVKKPGIRPAEITKAKRALILANREYCGTPVSDETLAALQTSERETLELYEIRLAHDCTTVRPEWYFARRAIPRIDSELLDYAGELWDIGQDILATRNNGRNHRNSGACMLYGSACQFLGVCSGYTSIESDQWQRKEQVHSELDGVEGDGRDLLTNSRVRCFQTCRRLHHYRYELGIERADEDERESLYFGTIYHLGLNAWWNAHRESSV